MGRGQLEVHALGQRNVTRRSVDLEQAIIIASSDFVRQYVASILVLAIDVGANNGGGQAEMLINGDGARSGSGDFIHINDGYRDRGRASLGG